MEILIIQTAFPGDLLLSLPLVKQTRHHFPQAKISLMCRQNLGQLFLEEKLVDELIEVKKGDSDSYTQAVARLKNRVDVVISPHRSFRTALFIQKIRPKMSIGYKRWWNALFFSKRIPYPLELPDALRQLKLLTLVSDEFKTKWYSSSFDKDLKGKKTEPVVSFDGLDFPDWMSAELRRLHPKGKVICIAPGSVWPTKRWPADHFSELTSKLLQDGYEVKLVGSPADQAECDQVANKNPQAQNLCGQTTLSELFNVFSESLLLISNDSGAMHMASAVGLPTIALFGPTVPEFGFRPWQKKAKILQVQLGCRPCSIHGTRKCPIGTHDCMRKLTVDFVYREARQSLMSH